MSDRIVIRDAVIARITSEQSTYVPRFMKDLSMDSVKGKDFDIYVLLGNEEIEAVLMEGVKYRVNTDIEVQVMVRGTAEEAEETDIQATLDTIQENIYDALMEWKTITTDIFDRALDIEYTGTVVGTFGNSAFYGGIINFTVTYDKN